jgi:hypothetical protein
VTYYVTLPFVAADDGIAPGEAVECFNPNAAVMRAETLSRKPGIVGAVAFSRGGHPATGNFVDATVLRKFGDVPGDLSALWAAAVAVSRTLVVFDQHPDDREPEDGDDHHRDRRLAVCPRRHQHHSQRFQPRHRTSPLHDPDGNVVDGLRRN